MFLGFVSEQSKLSFYLFSALLALVYNPYAIYKRGFRGWCNQFWERGVYCKYSILCNGVNLCYMLIWVCPDFFLGWVDMEGNYLVVKAYEYTSMLSAALLDSWSTPVCLILSFIFMRVRYRWVQYAGVFVALCGMGMLVGSDAMTGSTFMASDPVKGNLFCILGATFYGISNTSVEYLSRKHPIYEVNGMFTLFAAIINLVQMVILERNEFSAFVNNSYAIALVIVYTICMFILYSLAPVLFRWGSAVLYNLSLLTSDFYSLIFGLGLFGYSVSIRAIHCFGEPEIKTSSFFRSPSCIHLHMLSSSWVSAYTTSSLHLFQSSRKTTIQQRNVESGCGLDSISRLSHLESLLKAAPSEVASLTRMLP